MSSEGCKSAASRDTAGARDGYVAEPSSTLGVRSDLRRSSPRGHPLRRVGQDISYPGTTPSLAHINEHRRSLAQPDILPSYATPAHHHGPGPGPGHARATLGIIPSDPVPDSHSHRLMSCSRLSAVNEIGEECCTPRKKHSLPTISAKEKSSSQSLDTSSTMLHPRRASAPASFDAAHVRAFPLTSFNMKRLPANISTLWDHRRWREMRTFTEASHGTRWRHGTEIPSVVHKAAPSFLNRSPSVSGESRDDSGCYRHQVRVPKCAACNSNSTTSHHCADGPPDSLRFRATNSAPEVMIRMPSLGSNVVADGVTSALGPDDIAEARGADNGMQHRDEHNVQDHDENDQRHCDEPIDIEFLESDLVSHRPPRFSPCSDVELTPPIVFADDIPDSPFTEWSSTSNVSFDSNLRPLWRSPSGSAAPSFKQSSGIGSPSDKLSEVQRESFNCDPVCVCSKCSDRRFIASMSADTETMESLESVSAVVRAIDERRAFQSFRAEVVAAKRAEAKERMDEGRDTAEPQPSLEDRTAPSRWNDPSSPSAERRDEGRDCDAAKPQPSVDKSTAPSRWNDPSSPSAERRDEGRDCDAAKPQPSVDKSTAPSTWNGPSAPSSEIVFSPVSTSEGPNTSLFSSMPSNNPSVASNASTDPSGPRRSDEPRGDATAILPGTSGESKDHIFPRQRTAKSSCFSCVHHMRNIARARKHKGTPALSQ
eukprot:GEMP01006609.1.p1 GENE.GEMP01006609.1~~GEMP01006609.1.p1  ORF type:complete len:709 (+),score=162.76 GEMP01006609.1:350-2476(+)